MTRAAGRQIVSLRQHSAHFRSGRSSSARVPLLVSADSRHNRLHSCRSGQGWATGAVPAAPRVLCRTKVLYARTARGPLVRLRTQRFPQIRLLAAIALFAASSVSAHAQTNWTGASPPIGLSRLNWFAGVPSVRPMQTYNTMSPNSTVVASPGGTALNLVVGPNGTGMLVSRTAGH